MLSGKSATTVSTSRIPETRLGLQLAEAGPLPARLVCGQDPAEGRYFDELRCLEDSGDTPRAPASQERSVLVAVGWAACSRLASNQFPRISPRRTSRLRVRDGVCSPRLRTWVFKGENFAVASSLRRPLSSGDSASRAEPRSLVGNLREPRCFSLLCLEAFWSCFVEGLCEDYALCWRRRLGEQRVVSSSRPSCCSNKRQSE